MYYFQKVFGGDWWNKLNLTHKEKVHLSQLFKVHDAIIDGIDIELSNFDMVGSLDCIEDLVPGEEALLRDLEVHKGSRVFYLRELAIEILSILKKALYRPMSNFISSWK